MEAAWAAGIGVIGTLAGGILILIGGRFTSKDAERRLRTQLDHEARQRQQDRILQARLESTDNLMAVIKSTTAAMPVFVRSADTPQGIPSEIFGPLATDLQRAAVSMLAIEDEDAFKDVINVNGVISALQEAMDSNTASNLIPALTRALSALEKRYSNLKLKAILAGQAESSAAVQDAGVPRAEST